MTFRTNQMIESLEQRRLLSGVVTATLDTTGTLLIKGDSANNNIEVSGNANPGFIRVKGNTTAVNGVGFVDFVATSVAKINIQLNGGNDNANVHDLTNGPGGTAPPLNSITITDDAGNDGYNLFNDTLNPGSISVTTGGGFDNVFLQTVAAGSTSLNMGASNDFVNVFQGSGGSVSILGGDNDDNVNVQQSNYGSLTMDAGKGNDSIFLSTITTSSLNVKALDGNDTVHADNVTATSGVIDGGAGSDIFENGGGNSGFSVINFEGFI